MEIKNAAGYPQYIFGSAQSYEMTELARFYYLAGFRPLFVAGEVGKTVDYWQDVRQNLKDSEMLQFNQVRHYQTILDYYFQIGQWLDNKEDFVEKLREGDPDTLDILWIIYRDVEVSARTIIKKSEMLRSAILKHIEQPYYKRKILRQYEKLLSVKTYHAPRDLAFLDFLSAITSREKDVETIVDEINTRYNLKCPIDLTKPADKTGLEEAFWNVVDLQDLMELVFKENLAEKVNSKKYMEFLQEWHHNSDLKPFLVRTLELKRWNYGYFLKDFLNENPKSEQSEHLPFAAVSDALFNFYLSSEESRHSMHIDARRFADARLARVTPAKGNEGVLEILKKTKEVPEQLRNEIFAQNDRLCVYLTGNNSDFKDTTSIQLRISVFQIIVPEIYESLVRKLWNGTFGVLEENMTADEEHTVQKDFAAGVIDSFRSKMLKIVSKKDGSAAIRKSIKQLDQRIERDRSYLRALVAGKSLEDLYKLEQREKARLIRLDTRIESNEQLRIQQAQALAEGKMPGNRNSDQDHGDLAVRHSFSDLDLEEEEDNDDEEEDDDAEGDDFNLGSGCKDQETEDDLFIFESATLTEKIKSDVDNAGAPFLLAGLSLDGSAKGLLYAYERDFLKISWEDILGKYEPEVDFQNTNVRAAARQAAAKGRMLMMGNIYMFHEPQKSDARISSNIHISKRILEESNPEEKGNLEIAIAHSLLRKQQYPGQQIYDMLIARFLKPGAELSVKNRDKIREKAKAGGGLLLAKLKAEDLERDKEEINKIVEKIQKAYNHE
jgi:hypothetical protein